jgi:hypothetical protein
MKWRVVNDDDFRPTARMTAIAAAYDLPETEPTKMTLEVTIDVPSTDPKVIEAVEAAAKLHGVELQRLG